MMNQKATFALLGLFISANIQAQLGPIVTSWKINTTNDTGYAGLPADVQKVQYSDSFVYISCSDIPDYKIGPWNGNPNKAENQSFIYKLPRYPKHNTGTKVATGLGHIAVLVNGVSIFSASDAMSYKNENVWNQNGAYWELPSFDSCFGHPQQQGEYHHHGSPKCLYDQYDSSKHSPLIGFSFDGYPIYGAYGYANATKAGAVTRMRSGFRLRNITTRTTYADTSIHIAYPGPAVSTMYPLGAYLEDYEFVPGIGQLDSNNGRFCVTPEYPKGTYAYFVTVDSSGYPIYPYTLGLNYYGTVSQANLGPQGAKNTPTETVTTYTSIQKIAEEAIDFKVYPNPTADGKIYLTITSGENQQISATVYNPMGQLVYTANNLKEGTETEISLKGEPNGVYYIKIEGANSSTVQKVVVAHQ